MLKIKCDIYQQNLKELTSILSNLNNVQLEVVDRVSETQLQDMVNDHAINLLRTLDKDKPFFMILTHTVPHHPLQVPEQYLELFPDEKDEGRKKVKAMLAHLDHRTGDLVEALQEEGFYDNTIIMYTADNGGDTESHHDNSPQRGGKGSNFEGGARVLGFVHSPLLKNTDTVPHHDGLLHATDLHSTFVSLAGCHPGEDLDGIDQREMIMNGYGSKRSDVVYNIDLEEPAYFGHAAYRDTEYKIMWGFEGYADGYGLDATLAENYPPNLIDLGLDPDDFDQSSEAQSQRLLDLIELRKMVPHDINSGSVRLFNLKKDPEERTNLAEDPSQAWRVMAMKKKILSLIEEGYQIPPPESKQFWAAEAFAAREQGAWGTGWCDNLEFNRNVKP